MRNRQSCRAIIRLINLVLIASVIALATQAMAGPAKPPLQLLFSANSRLVIGTLVEINPTGRLVFKRKTVFGEFKDIPELVDVGVTSHALQNAQIGQRYIVGYTVFRHDRQYPAGVAPTRKGTDVISSSGLDPALFLDSPEVRRILELAASKQGRESKKLRELLLRTFAEHDPALQRLAAGQFAYDTAMSSKLNADGNSILRHAANNEKTNPTTRSILIGAAADRPGDFGAWAAEAINKVLEITPLDGYSPESPDPTGLVLLAFDEASARGIDVPLVSLSRWLLSSQQLYLERASGLIETMYPERAESVFEEALGDVNADPAARRFIETRLRQGNQQVVAPAANRN